MGDPVGVERVSVGIGLRGFAPAGYFWGSPAGIKGRDGPTLLGSGLCCNPMIL